MQKIKKQKEKKEKKFFEDNNKFAHPPAHIKKIK